MGQRVEVKHWSTCTCYFWYVLIRTLESLIEQILEVYGEKDVIQKSSLMILLWWEILSRICCCKWGTKVNGRNSKLLEYPYHEIFHKSCDLFWLWELKKLKGLKYDADTVENLHEFEFLFKGIEAELTSHHQQFMQPKIILTFILLACVFYSTKPMENFNMNINDSPNASSAGSSEVTQEALLELCVAGTLLTDKPVRFQILEDRLPSIWRPGQGVTITQAEENKFLF